MNRSTLLHMLALQSGMNAAVNPEWKTADYPWLRAVVVEGAEALEHIGWKWWKKQTPDIEQFKIELVDIWHFALSDAILREGGSEELAAVSIETWLSSPYQRQGIMHGSKNFEYAKMSTIERIELMIGLASTRRFSFSLFETIMRDVSMSWMDLYTMYIAKNVLNFFRQDNGYKTGTYIKNWGGQEDNVRLAEIVAEIGDPPENFADLLYERLRMMYSTVLTAQAVK